MDSAFVPCSAQFVPRDMFDQAVSCVSRAEAEAAHATDTAMLQIAERQAELDARIAGFEAKLAAAEETAFRDLVDQQAVTARAAQAEEILDHAARFQAELTDTAPLLADLVATCMHRVIGQLAPDDVLAAVIKVAVDELRTRSALTLLVAPQDHASVTATIAAAPEKFAAVADVTVDADVPAGTMYLDGTGGLTDIGLSTQINAVCTALRQAETHDGDLS